MRGRGKGGLLLRAARFDADNLAVARQVMAEPEKHGPALRDWAERVLRRLGNRDDLQEQQPKTSQLAFTEFRR